MLTAPACANVKNDNLFRSLNGVMHNACMAFHYALFIMVLAMPLYSFKYMGLCPLTLLVLILSLRLPVTVMSYSGVFSKFSQVLRGLEVGMPEAWLMNVVHQYTVDAIKAAPIPEEILQRRREMAASKEQETLM